MSGPRHGSGVRPALCQASAQVFQLPSPTCSAGVGVVDQDALGQRVGGEEHLVVVGQRGRRVAHGAGQELDVGRFQVPMVDGLVDDAVGVTGLGGAALVLAHREPRVVRGQHQTDRSPDALGRERRDGVFDERRGVLLAQANNEPAGGGGIERCFDGGPLGFRALGQR
jgi:hypothetical protein